MTEDFESFEGFAEGASTGAGSATLLLFGSWGDGGFRVRLL